MAIPSDAVWEVRTTGSDSLCSGAFSVSLSNVGTSVDYSLNVSNAAQVVFSSGNANRLNAVQNSTTVTSDGTPFTAAMQGNAIQITGGTNWVAGWYFVTAFGSSSSITVDRAPCTAGNGSVGVGALGGALLTLTKPGVVAGNTVYAKATATYTVTSSQTYGAAGTNALPIAYIGYTSARTDGGSVTVQQTGASTGIALFHPTGGFLRFANFIADSNAKTGGIGWSSDTAGTITLVNCQALNFTSQGFAIAVRTELLNCYASGGSSAATAAFNITALSVLLGCTAAGNACPGFLYNATASNTSGQFIRCISANNTGASSDGFRNANLSAMLLFGCVAYANGRDGILFDTTTVATAGNQAVVLSCISVNNVGYGFNSNTVNFGAAALNLLLDYNAVYGNNSSGAQRNQVPTGSHDVTLSADPFTNGSGGDFSLTNAAGGGAACKAAGFPGAFNGIATTGYADIGAAQSRGGSGVSRGRTIQ